MIDLDLSGCVRVKRVKWAIISISLPWHLVHTLVFCILPYSLYFFKFPTPSKDVAFHIHWSHMEIGLSEPIKFCTIKMFNKRHTSCLHAKWIICFTLWWYIYTYLPTYLPNYLPTYLPTYLHTYIHTYIHTPFKRIENLDLKNVV